MSKLKPKVELDAEMLKKIVSYYRINTSDELWDDEEFLNWECFSHPSLELHECNTRALMPGRHKCKYCNHVVGKPCTVSCHLQNFCLALFAWRMGVGGETIEEALEYNLYKLEPEELYLKVIEKFSLGTNSETIELKSALNIDIPDKGIFEVEPEFVPSEEENVMQESNVVVPPVIPVMPEAPVVPEAPAVPEVPVVPEAVSVLPETAGDRWLDISEAANWYGCTYSNIYNHVRTGRLASEKQGKKFFIKMSDLQAFKDRPKHRRIKKDAE